MLVPHAPRHVAPLPAGMRDPVSILFERWIASSLLIRGFIILICLCVAIVRAEEPRRPLPDATSGTDALKDYAPRTAAEVLEATGAGTAAPDGLPRAGI